MSSDATIISHGALVGAGSVSTPRVERRARVDAAIAAVSMLVIVGICLLVVVLAANRPTFFVPTTHAGFFPGWLAGPLGGLWPSFTYSSTALKYIWTFGMVVMYAAYVVAFAFVPRLRSGWVIAAVVAAHVVMLLSPPLSLTDIFNYINYGRMQAVHHLNPYATIPYYEPHGDPSFELSNWHHLLSPYGPLFTVFTFALVPLGVAASFWTLKVILLAASLGTLALVWACARLLGREPRQAIVFVGLNPLVLLWGLGGDHNDFLMMLLIMGAFYLLLRARALRPPSEVAPDLAAAPTVVFPAPPVPSSGSGGAGRFARIRHLGRRPWGRGAGQLSIGAAGAASAPSAAAPAPASASASPGAATATPAPAPETASATPAGPGAQGAPPAGATPAELADAAPETDASSNGSRAWAPLAAWSRPRPRDLTALVWPLAPLDIGAGALLVAAVAIKASAAILLPVVLMALLVRPRDLVQVLIGVVVSAVALGAMTYIAFGAHIPDLSTQAKLVTSVSIPNLVGLALGQGGETHAIRLAMEVVLVLGVLASAWWASRHRDLGPDALVTGAGWASVVLVVTLSWVLPWYVLWTLPLAVLSRSRALRRTVLVLGVYLIFAWMPLQADLFRQIHFKPLGTSLGQLDQRQTKQLLH